MSGIYLPSNFAMRLYLDQDSTLVLKEGARSVDKITIKGGLDSNWWVQRPLSTLVEMVVRSEEGDDYDMGRVVGIAEKCPDSFMIKFTQSKGFSRAITIQKNEFFMNLKPRKAREETIVSNVMNGLGIPHAHVRHPSLPPLIHAGILNNTYGEPIISQLKCSCEMFSLMNHGCRCGAIELERKV